MRPLERELNAAALHVSRYIDVALVPRCAKIVTRWLRQKRHFDFAAFSVSLVVFTQVPVAIVEREHPRSVSRDLVSKVLCLKNSRQTNGPAQWSHEPLLQQTCISRIRFKTPIAIE